MGQIEVRYVHMTRTHAREIGRSMRPADAAEVLASGGYLPEAAARRSLNLSHAAWAAYLGDELLAVFGVIPTEGGGGIGWLLSTTAVDRHPLTFWRESKKVLAVLRDHYPFLKNMVDARYTQAVSWLRRLGFDVGQAVPFGKAQLPFHPVIIRRSLWLPKAA